MIALSLAVLTTGLVLGVFAMLYGTERRVSVATGVKPHERTGEHNPSLEPSPLFNLASVGAFSMGFGLCGYLVAQHTTWPIGLGVCSALLAGGGACGLQSLLIARWAIPSARAEQVDERYLLQGTLARISHDVPPDGIGRLRYALDGFECELAARDLEGNAVAAGTDVVIDHVDAGVAVVELWARVERRL